LAGGWYNDLLFKADLLDVDYTTTFQTGKATPEIDSFGIRYDTGYRFNLGGGFFVDPQGTIAWVDTDADNFALLNSAVKFSDGESVRGRLGGRIGYSAMWGTAIVEPFFTGSFWHEFESDNKATISNSGFNLAFKDEIDDSWGELGGGVNLFAGPRTSAFVKADALVGGDIEGWNVKGGGRLAW
jgi:outer membrane autotransporter protein